MAWLKCCEEKHCGLDSSPLQRGKKKCIFAHRLRGRSGASLAGWLHTRSLLRRILPQPPTTPTPPSNSVPVHTHSFWWRTIFSGKKKKKTQSTINKIVTGSLESATAMLVPLTPDKYDLPTASPAWYIALPAHFSLSSAHIFFRLPFPACLAAETVLVTEDVLTSADRYRLPN